MVEHSKFSYKELLLNIENSLGDKASKRIKDALQLALTGHEGQLRESKVPDEQFPFIVHPVGTARLAIKYYSICPNIPDDLETVVCVALVHDLLEDTRVDIKQIRDVTNIKIQGYIESLTKPPIGLAGRPVSERNLEFLDRIASAGPTAAFIKICDSMHNLSRPSVTPLHLLRKLIDKAENQYMSLITRCSLGDDLREAYQTAIETAKESLSQEEQYTRQLPDVVGLESAISLCTLESSSKILEVHDIVDLLYRTCKPKSVTIWRYGSGGHDFITRVEGKEDDKNKNKRVPISGLSESPKRFEKSEAGYFPTDLVNERCTTIYMIPMPVDALTKLIVVLGYDNNGPPFWLSLDSATVIIQFLAHRLILSQADLRTRLASTASFLEMRMDVELAVTVGVRPFELEQLQQWLSRCQEAISTVRQWINTVLSNYSSDIPLAEEVRVTSRVKGVDSILNKFSPLGELSWPMFEEIEDIAGVRVVCPTLPTLHIIENFLTNEKAQVAGLKPYGKLKHSRRDYISSPLANGYRALHLILEVDTRLSDEGIQRVPCEVQLRTIFQDSWATVSHATLYRASRNERRKLGPQLKQLSEVLMSCDEISEDLVRRQLKQ